MSVRAWTTTITLLVAMLFAAGCRADGSGVAPIEPPADLTAPPADLTEPPADLTEPPADLAVDIAWNSGVSEVGPGYFAYRILLAAPGRGTIGYWIGHPSSADQVVAEEMFDIGDDDLDALYAELREAGVLSTREWQRADLVPGSGAGVTIRATAAGKEYRVPSDLSDAGDRATVEAIHEHVRLLVPDTIWATIDARRARYVAEHSP